jgi:hypothetical protein
MGALARPSSARWWGSLQARVLQQQIQHEAEQHHDQQQRGHGSAPPVAASPPPQPSPADQPYRNRCEGDERRRSDGEVGEHLGDFGRFTNRRWTEDVWAQVVAGNDSIHRHFNGNNKLRPNFSIRFMEPIRDILLRALLASVCYPAS